MYRTVYDLNREELNELKQSYLCEMYDQEGECPSYGELAAVDEIIPDDVVYSHYEDISFVDDDFFCNM